LAQVHSEEEIDQSPVMSLVRRFASRGRLYRPCSVLVPRAVARAPAPMVYVRSRAFCSRTEIPKVVPVNDEGFTSQEVQDKSFMLKVNGTAVLAGTAVMGWVSWRLTAKVLQLIGVLYSSPHLAAYIGFWTGCTSSAIAGAAAFCAYRLTHIRPENVHKQALAKLRNHPDVVKLIGNSIMPAKLKAYEIKDGKLIMRDGKPQWAPHKVEMMFVVQGERCKGLVCADAVKVMWPPVPGALSFNFLAVDVMDKKRISDDTETIVVAGDASQGSQVRDNIKQFLDMKVDFLQKE